MPGVGLIQVLLTVLIICHACADSDILRGKLCRSRLGYHASTESFRQHSYALCFNFVFYLKFRPFLNTTGPTPVVDIIHDGRRIRFESMDFRNETIKSSVCSLLSRDECHQWTSCCESAELCCQRQLSEYKGTNSTCGRIWDGWLCWDDAAPGTQSYGSCPLFMPYFTPSRQAVRTCQVNGQWIHRTDYNPCLKKDELETTLLIGLGCSVASLVVLLPAVLVFLKFKSLRKQHRIRLHINLFLSFVFKEVMEILWDMLVTHDKVTSTTVFETTLLKNGVGCKLLSFLKIYFKCCTYTWMFCEGFYLHRLMSNAFSPPRSLRVMYVFGWAVPLVSSTLYGILRGILNNESCWAFAYGNLEWIFDTPNILFLFLNLVFLSNILRILLTQIQTHPNEPGNFRRAVKATFILIPLFGIHLFVTIYRIPISNEGGLEYERVSVIISHTQGFFVAMVFCFLNGEVISNIKRSVRHYRSRSFSASKRLNQTTQQTLSIRSEYDATKTGDQCYKSLIVPTEDKEELELKETSTNGNIHGNT
ncbi:calcitonin gene-related peptide type 1 receptor-like [Saccostrea echinata]|uniref:calcitonin gene-related peptide type 1 receptor-like n=1 Tax=Saccostrea echinata TaxID=191078 RepID=UPI002A83DCD3|nr:calcitonin gene-related peptide type 1 receptor-like [Saccostrea echinata]